MRIESAFVQAGDACLQYFQHGSGSEVILFVHGFTASARIWAKLQPEFEAEQYRTIALSNRGAGDSSRGQSSADYTVEAFARDLNNAVEALGLTNFTLVGHSLGAATATQFALDHGDRLKALVLLNPVPLDGSTWHDGWRDELETMFAQALRPMPGTATSEFDAALQADAMRNPLERRDGSIEAMAALQLRQRLHELTMPVMVIGGDQDTVVGVDNILAEYVALPPGNRSLHVFHSVGHSPNVEIPGRLAGTLRRFIRGITGT